MLCLAFPSEYTEKVHSSIRWHNYAPLCTEVDKQHGVLLNTV